MAPVTPAKLDITALPTAQATLIAAPMVLVRRTSLSTHLHETLTIKDTTSCAVQYSLSVSLVRQTGVVTPSATPLASTLPAETPVPTSQLGASSAASFSARTSATVPTT